MSSKYKRIAQRRVNVAKYFSQGMNQFEIADLVGVERSTVSLDLKALEKQWIEAAVDEIAAYKAQEIIKINNMEREAYEAWEKSKNEKETKSKKQSDLTSLKKTELSIKTESNFGDDKYLKLVQWCIEKRCKLLGLDAPEKHELTGKDGNDLNINITYNEHKPTD